MLVQHSGIEALLGVCWHCWNIRQWQKKKKKKKGKTTCAQTSEKAVARVMRMKPLDLNEASECSYAHEEIHGERKHLSTIFWSCMITVQGVSLCIVLDSDRPTMFVDFLFSGISLALQLYKYRVIHPKLLNSRLLHWRLIKLYVYHNCFNTCPLLVVFWGDESVYLRGFVGILFLFSAHIFFFRCRKNVPSIRKIA